MREALEAAGRPTRHELEAIVKCLASDVPCDRSNMGPMVTLLVQSTGLELDDNEVLPDDPDHVDNIPSDLPVMLPVTKPTQSTALQMPPDEGHASLVSLAPCLPDAPAGQDSETSVAELCGRRGRNPRWTLEEEDQLCQLLRQMGNSWEAIANQLGTGRTPIGVQQHWQILTGRRKRKRDLVDQVRPGAVHHAVLIGLSPGAMHHDARSLLCIMLLLVGS